MTWTTTQLRRAGRLALGALALGAAITACSGDDDPEGDPDGTGGAPDDGTGGKGTGGDGTGGGTGGGGTGGMPEGGPCAPGELPQYTEPGCDGTPEPSCVSGMGGALGFAACSCDGETVTGACSGCAPVPFAYAGECKDAGGDAADATPDAADASDGASPDASDASPD